jgi:hypothetical protein
MNDDSLPLKRVTLTFEPYGGFAQDHTFDGLTETDLAFVAVALYARMGRAATGDPAVVRFYNEARLSSLAWYEARMHESLDEGLGWFRRLLPARLRQRIIGLQMGHIKKAVESWSVELGDLHAQVQDMGTKVTEMHEETARRRRAARTSRAGAEAGVRMMCSETVCRSTTPLGQDLPEGWSLDGDGAHCPQHTAPVTTAMKVA